MDAEPPTVRLLAIACRFVPYDQWFITHLDSSWKIKQVKHWLLSKCNSLQAPDPPRYRPVSPITFAATTRAKGSFEQTSAEESPYDDEDKEYDDDDSDELEFSHLEYNRPHAAHRYSRELEHGVNPGEPQVEQRASAAKPQPFTQYALMTYSTGQILEDDFPLSWYNLRPYELLELHRTGLIITLPRHIPQEYVQPYYEVRVKALRVVWREKEEKDSSKKAKAKAKDSSQGETSSGGKVTGDNGVVPTALRKRRTKVEWQERWIIVHQGILNLCRDRFDPQPSHRFPLDTLCALRGADHLAKKIHSLSVMNRRIVCAKFRISPAPKTKSKSKAPSGSTPSSPVDARNSDWHIVEPRDARRVSNVEEERWQDRDVGQTKLDSKVHEDANEDYEWLVLDMLDDNAYSSILRILHRDFPRPISSSFISPSPDDARSTSSPTTTPTSPIPLGPFPPHPSFGSIGTCPYPEWRVNAVNKAQRAGMGEVGKAMEWFMWGDENVNLWAEPSVGLGQAAAALSPIPQDLHHESMGSGSDSSDGESEAEWEGWPRDLQRQGRIQQTLAAFSDDRDEQQQPFHLHLLQDRMVQLERKAYEPTGRIYRVGAPPVALSSPSSNESIRHVMSSFAFSPPRNTSPPASQTASTSTDMDDLTAMQPIPLGRMTTTSTVTVGNTPPEKSRKGGRNRSSTITAGILRRGKDKDKGKEPERDEKDKDKKGKLQKPKLSLTFSPTTSTSTPEGSSSQSTQSSSRPTGLRHARSGSSLCTGSTAAENFGDNEPTSPVDHANGSGGGAKAAKKRLGGGLGLVRGVSVRAEKLVRGS